MSWAEAADAAQRVLAERFWHPRFALYQDKPGRQRFAVRLSWDYWIQAHALDVTVDAAARTGSTGLRDRIRANVGGIVRRNGGTIVNRYYDDMAWMGIALLRADEVAGADTGGLVRELWSDIRAGWDERHGGIVWRREDPRPYTNTPANAPSAILAAKLHRRYRDPADLDWARRIADWQYATLVDPASGMVWDGVHPAEQPGPDRTLWTYNQGTVVGAETELWQLTGDRGHLDRARRTAAAALDHFADPSGGVLPNEGMGDSSVFKGIFAHYLGALVLADPDPDGAVARQVRAALTSSGGAVAAAAAAPIGSDWRQPVSGEASLGTQVSAALLLEALATVEHPDVTHG
ncbi:MAG TPA: glycoside hydrolase family 76 protein [Mycobacteriales bacterium]|nr:glycoside hydrolase family 76 protein [Mycobacteriales bacterium]